MTPRLLHSSDHCLLHDVGAKTVFGSRAFCHAAPSVCNSLPPYLTDDFNSEFYPLLNVVSKLTSIINLFYPSHVTVFRACDSFLLSWHMARYQPCNNNNNNNNNSRHTLLVIWENLFNTMYHHSPPTTALHITIAWSVLLCVSSVTVLHRAKAAGWMRCQVAGTLMWTQVTLRIASL